MLLILPDLLVAVMLLRKGESLSSTVSIQKQEI